jgi:hypothetical protein
MPLSTPSGRPGSQADAAPRTRTVTSSPGCRNRRATPCGVRSKARRIDIVMTAAYRQPTTAIVTPSAPQSTPSTTRDSHDHAPAAPASGQVNRALAQWSLLFRTPGGQANTALLLCSMYSFSASLSPSLRCSGTNCVRGSFW